MTLTLFASLVAACSTDSGGKPDAAVPNDAASSPTADAAPSSACPVSEPTAGTACPQTGHTCGYDVTSPTSGTIRVFLCQDGTWQQSGVQSVASTVVGAPPFVCPAQQPGSGDACSMTDMPANPNGTPARSSECYFHTTPLPVIVTCQCTTLANAWTWTCSSHEY